MHDLVHDLARLVLADELILGVSKLGNTDRSSCRRYALFDDCSKKLESYTDSPAKIKALRFLNCGKIGLHSDAFSSAKYIRVLDLSDCFIQELPDSVGQLKQLRYLNAPKIQHQMIPNSITKLLKLMYLSLRGSSALLEMPDSIGDLEGLMYLDLSCCSELEKLPESFARLKKLVHLDLSNCTNVTGVSESLPSLTNLEFLDISYCWNVRALPDHLGNLLKLKYLNMSGCDEIEELPGSFGNLQNLVHLDLSHCCQIQVTPDVLGGLSKLQYLNLSHCGCIGRTKVAEAMRNLPELRYLYLSGFMDTVCLDESAMSTSLEYISTLSNLEHLDLSCNVGLSHLPESIGSLGKLHTLDLSDCSSLQSVPETIVQMQSLKLAYLKDCGLDSALLDHEFKVHGHAIKGSNNFALLQAMNVTKLKVYGLEEVKSIEEMKSIKLVVGQQGINELRFVWSSRYHERVVDDHEVLRGLEPASTVQSLDIESYNSVLFPDWLVGIPAYNFPDLTRISLVDLGNCISLPPLGQLPNLMKLVLRKMPSVVKIDEAFCGGGVAFPRLESFTLDNMESLKVWKTTYSSGGYMFPSLRQLEIHGCPELRLKPCLPKAERWTIVESDGVISSWEESTSDTGATTSSSPPDTTLRIQGCKVPMHEWRLIHHIPALRDLHIEDCSDLTSSPEIARALSTLKYLSVDRCDLAPLPEWLGHLTSLEELELRCPLLSSWGESTLSDNGATTSSSPPVTTLRIQGCKVPMHQWRLIHHLPALRDLHIKDCTDLTSSPEITQALSPLKCLSVNECNLAQLPEWLGHLTSLETLVLENSEVEALQLQEVAKHLTSLQTLFLKDCNSMISLPQWVGDLGYLLGLWMERCPKLNNLQEIKGCLTSLEDLYISDCDGLESLPESIQQSTKLKHLLIEGCPALYRWCETEENKRKLSHIKDVYIH